MTTNTATVPASDLVPGDSLVERDGALLEIASVTREADTGTVLIAFRRTGISRVAPIVIAADRRVRRFVAL